MDERKNKMTDQRYREILPMAYMTAAIEKGRQPRPVEVGLCARAIVDAEDENNLGLTLLHIDLCNCRQARRRPWRTGHSPFHRNP